jgi:hypothetical protein
MDVCLLSGRGRCDELITRPEESYRLWCVVVCDLENLKNEEAMTHVGSQDHRKKNEHKLYLTHSISPYNYGCRPTSVPPQMKLPFSNRFTHPILSHPFCLQLPALLFVPVVVYLSKAPLALDLTSALSSATTTLCSAVERRKLSPSLHSARDPRQPLDTR